jgi:hypothetical protein
MMHRRGCDVMTEKPIDIVIRVGADEAKALLKFLRHVTDLEVMHALDIRLDEMSLRSGIRESEKPRVALRKILAGG